MFSLSSTKSYTFLFVFAVFTRTVTCAPAPIANPNPDTTNQINNSYSGAGGHASGGSVSNNPSNPILLGGGLLDFASGNGGTGGTAKSGPALAGSGPVAIAGPGSSTPTTSDPNGSTSSSGSTHTEAGNAFSGAGGVADGGSVSNNSPSLIRLFSDNGGNGGDASSGASGPGVLLSGVGRPSKANSGPRRGGKVRVARFYKINLD